MNNCETCDHIKNPDGGHCYMFREEPITKCMKHTAIATASVFPFFDINRNDVVNFGTDAVDLGLDIMNFLPNKAREVFTSGGGGDFGGGGASGAWDSITETASSGLTAASDAASSGLDAVLTAGAATLEFAGSTIEGAGDVAGSIVEGAGDVLGGIADVAGSITDI